jgi:small conductance mechanosensitive channel
MNTGIKIVIALLVLFISFRIITLVTRRFTKKLVNGKHKADKTIVSTLMYVLGVALKVVIVISLIGYVGIDTSGITALVASLGVCFGLAVNGAVSNIAGGVLILITRPFRVDDFIEAEGFSGIVEDIRITHTKLRTGDNKTIFIPNGKLSSGSIVNYSMKDTRRVDLSFGISYESNVEHALEIIKGLVEAHPLGLKEPASFVKVTGHSDSSIDISARLWTKSSDYWTAYFDLLESVRAALDKAEDVEIPYNKLEVIVKK